MPTTYLMLCYVGITAYQTYLNFRYHFSDNHPEPEFENRRGGFRRVAQTQNNTSVGRLVKKRNSVKTHFLVDARLCRSNENNPLFNVREIDLFPPSFF